jgi:orotidine-5'-phosphate decarboxylase
MAEKDPRDQLIVALDLPSSDQARHHVRALANTITTFKVGSQLFTAAGPQFVCELVASGYKVFLDLKFHDIPNTVAAAVRSAAALGASMLTVHASGGIKMLRAAVEAASRASRPPLVLAVTVLTSLNDEDLTEIGVGGSVPDQVLRLAALARDAGCDGVVASPREVSELRRELGTGFAIVAPGVRPRDAAPGDQARVATPAEALAAGATHLVIGRPIIEAGDPARAARAVLQEMTAAVR